MNYKVDAAHGSDSRCLAGKAVLSISVKLTGKSPWRNMPNVLNDIPLIKVKDERPISTVSDPMCYRLPLR